MGGCVTQNLSYVIQILIDFPCLPDEPYARNLQAQGACALRFFQKKVVNFAILKLKPLSKEKAHVRLLGTQEYFSYLPDEPYARDLQAQGACALRFLV